MRGERKGGMERSSRESGGQGVSFLPPSICTSLAAGSAAITPSKASTSPSWNSCRAAAPGARAARAARGPAEVKPVPWAEYETEGGPWRLALALERLPLPPPWLEAVAASWPLLVPPGAASNATTCPAGIPLGESKW